MEKLTVIYKETLAAAKQQVGENFINGFGEIEQYAWDIQPNDPQLPQLYDLTAENKVAVMFHLAPGQSTGVTAEFNPAYKAYLICCACCCA